MTTLINNRQLLIAIVISIIIAIVPYYLLFVVLIAAFFFIKEIFSKETILPVIFFVLVTASGESFEVIRNIINLICTILIIYLFINKYGLKFSNYPSIPSRVLSFVYLFIISLLISSSISGFQIESLIAIVRTSIFFGITYLFYSLINNQIQLYSFLQAFMVSTFVISLTIYHQVIMEGFTFFLISGVLARYSGAYPGYNFVGYLMMVSTLIAFIFLLTRNRSRKKIRVLTGIFILNNLIILIILNSRLAFFGTFV